MGYRSNGKLWLSKKAEAKLTEELKQDLKDSWQYDEDNTWSFDDWKWYPSYDQVKIWEDFMSLCENQELDYAFVRLGENYDDIEMKGQDPHDIFWVSREIIKN